MSPASSSRICCALSGLPNCVLHILRIGLQTKRLGSALSDLSSTGSPDTADAAELSTEPLDLSESSASSSISVTYRLRMWSNFSSTDSTCGELPKATRRCAGKPTVGHNQSLIMSAQFRVIASELIPLRESRSSLAATLDCPYVVLANAVSTLPMPRLRPHRDAARLRVELTLPNGSVTQHFASVAAVTPMDAPAAITFVGLAVAEVPVGSSVRLLQFETQPR